MGNSGSPKRRPHHLKKIDVEKSNSPFPDSPKRPTILEDFLSMTDEAATQEVDLYKQFLQEVELSQRNMLQFQSTCSIKMIHKLSQVKQKASSPKESQNSSLTSIITFYSQLQSTEYHSTFESVGSSFSLKMTTLICMLRDFDVIPSLLTKDDIVYLWKKISLDSAKAGQKAVTTLDVEGIKDFLARAAILAYNKDGWRRLILTVNSSMPSQAELVVLLCKHIRLDNFEFVFQHLSTVGQQRIENTRKENRKKMVEALKNEHSADLLAKRSEKIIRELQEKAEIKRVLVDQHDIIDPLTNSLDQDDLKSAADCSKAFTVSTSSTLRRMTGAANISLIQEEELAKFNPNLKQLLDSYSASPQKKARQGNDGLTISEGSFLDLGEIIGGRKCTINVIIRNNCQHDIQFDVIANGFASKETSVTAHPGSVASGLSRTITVSFVVPNNRLDYLSYIQISVLPTKLEVPIDILCPIFYRAVQTADVSERCNPLPVCSVRNLSEILRQYCKIDNPSTVCFEKTQNWYSGPGWRSGPNFELGLTRSSGLHSSQSSNTLIQIPGCYRGLRTSVLGQPQYI